ncbi:MAG: 1-(5-phosphoribosyl)-5-amino-4-imidazole-carboxylate carboxylase, partial [Acidobacteriota bacterium]
MKPTTLLELLSAVEQGTLTPDAAADRLKSLPFEDLGHTRVDHHRSLRSGLPEVIYAANKTPQQTLEIFTALAATGVEVLATRVDDLTATLVRDHHPQSHHNPIARTLSLTNPAAETQGHIAILCAGTSDIPIAEEAAVT